MVFTFLWETPTSLGTAILVKQYNTFQPKMAGCLNYASEAMCQKDIIPLGLKLPLQVPQNFLPLWNRQYISLPAAHAAQNRRLVFQVQF